MSKPPSYERVDYSIRTNKNIERKLVFERLQVLLRSFDFGAYRYMGLGSMWFIDFVLAHRQLGIKEMWSFEEKNAARADFNKPYHCIDVKAQKSSAGIQAMGADDWLKPAIVWFDYDGAFDGDVKDDCERLLDRLLPGSVLIVTVNSDKRVYKPSGPADQTAPAITKLRELLADAVPVTATGGKGDIEAGEFPAVFGTAILSFMTGAVRRAGRVDSGQPVVFVPLFNLQHRDGATMSTLGGMLANAAQLDRLQNLFSLTEAQLLADGALLKEVLDIVPITSKEKSALDRLLPCDEAGFSARLAASGVRLDETEARKYLKLYTQFPVFAETVS